MSQVSINPSLDGQIQNALQATWAGARDAASGTVDTTDTRVIARGEYNGTQYNCGRAYFVFDLRSYAHSSDIYQVDLVLYSDVVQGSGGDYNTIEVFQSNQASSTNLATTDFVLFGSTLLAPTQVISTTGSKTFTLNTSGLTYVKGQFGSYAMFCLRNKIDVDNTTPLALGNVQFGSVDNSDSTKRPVLKLYKNDFVGMV